MKSRERPEGPTTRKWQRQALGAVLIAALAALVAVGLWKTSQPPPRPHYVVLVEQPRGIMGTSCSLTALAADEETAGRALKEAESALREVEARMSSWLADSEIGRLNTAPAGEQVPLSAATVDVLQAAHKAATDTQGAFDVTIGPLINTWKQAGKAGKLPAEQDLTRARAASSWRLIELRAGGAVKKADTARVDLGGIAKGFGIDRALAAMKREGAIGGLVDVGGDLRCFGQAPDGASWAVDVRDPFGDGNLAELQVREAAVCTSGNYARYVEIGGKRYSHIIDPRTGWPAETAPCVTVIAAQTITADIWATALSVLGERGLNLLPPGVEAMVVLGRPADHRLLYTPGFEAMLKGPAPAGVVLGRERSGPPVSQPSPRP